jgi:PAS domain S-box-containing protein
LKFRAAAPPPRATTREPDSMPPAAPYSATAGDESPDAARYRRQLETIAANATLALFIMDEHQQCTFMNPAAERLTGYTLAEVHGRVLHDVIHHTRPDGTPYPLEECAIDRAFPENLREQGEEVFVHKDGHFYPVAFTASPILEDGRPVGTIIEVRDISDEIAARQERARLLRKIEEQRRRLELVFEQTPAFIATARGPEHVFEMANPIYYQIVGHRDILGKPVREAVPEVVEQGLVEVLDEVYRTGKPFTATEMSVWLQRTPGGVLEECYFNLVYQPLRGDDGQVTGILAHGVEVTELVEARRRLEEQATELEAQQEERQVQAAHLEEVQIELEASNEELQQTIEQLARERTHLATVIEHAPVGIVIAEAPSGRILAGNRRVEEIFRHRVLPSETVDAYRDWTAYHADGRRVEGHEYPLGRVFLTGEPAGPDEYLYQRGDGTLAWVQLTGAPILDTNGRLTGGLVVVEDIDSRKRAEQERERLIRALDTERARLEEIFQQAPAMIAVLRGEALRFELANAPYLASVGRSELVGKTVREALSELEGQGYFEMLEEVYRRGEAVVGRESLALLDRQGTGVLEPAYFNLVFQPLRNGDGQVDGILIHAVDVTDHVEARHTVERLEERLRLALEAADIGAYDWDLAAGVLNWDRRTRQIFGVSPDEEVSYATFERVIHPDDAAQAHAAVERALDPAGPGDFAMEYRVVWPDSSMHWVRAVGRIYFEGEGAERRAVRFLGTVHDVTARRDAEAERERLIAALETERTRLRQIFEEAPAVKALYSGPEHRITLVNPTWERTVGKPNAVGRPFREVFPEFEGTGLFEKLDEIYETGEPFIAPELHVPLERFGSGVVEDTYWNLMWRPLAGEGPHGRDVLVHAVEVTAQVAARREIEAKAEELARVAQKLEASNRDLDQFAYAASHDLRAPLRGIANLATWIEEDLGERATAETKEHLELLRNRVRRMEGLIEGILQYSRAGRVRDKAEVVDIEPLLREVIELIAPPPAVEVHIGAGMPRLTSERAPLQQVWMNLIGNAIKYNKGEHPRVEIAAADAGDCYEFSVADNGPGIAAEYHERIFGIFQTLEARDKVEGTGIGLSLVKRLVESRGGRVWVESQEGAGATFRFTWPKEASDAAVG